ncbi:methylated-DNA--[protein]-cysteine S-methyltransferase [Pseudoflavonifractor phocaeensis]|uniref:methylated-DNA--[protein]-cysteine S-methyltransferase n=1 Tax=Pseudoflavonifractor phocaeensis TaxID=1870988 RepID=UPI002FF91FD1
MARVRFPTPVGPMTLEGTEASLTALYLPNTPMLSEGTETPLLAKGREELLDYLAGERRTFDLPLDPRGTPFQLAVWHALAEIPYGQTVTYGALAGRLGRPKAGRAVGQANHRNPLPIFLPCHRVVGTKGALTGYAGGLELKAWLLRLEGIV